MPWRVSSVMEERLRFILEYEAGEESMTELCQRYDISRETGYLTLRRYRASGIGGLLPQSHAAARHDLMEQAAPSLRKPFAMDTLARKIMEVLASQPVSR